MHMPRSCDCPLAECSCLAPPGAFSHNSESTGCGGYSFFIRYQYQLIIIEQRLNNISELKNVLHTIYVICVVYSLDFNIELTN